MHAPPSIAVVTPAFREVATLPGLAASLERQDPAPAAWLIVDDGSDDGTWGVARALAARIPWAHALRRRRPGDYALETGSEAAAFNLGLAELGRLGVAWDAVLKLDADLVLDDGFLRALGDAFAADAGLGLAGGVLDIRVEGVRRREPVAAGHVRGATKAYRRDCLAAIGGIREALGWDTVDEVQAARLGWRVAVVPGATALHLRPTGSTAGVLRGRARHGRTSYLVGYPAWAVCARAARRCLERPVLAGSAALLWGYARARLAREPLAAPPEAVAALRRDQRRRLAAAVGR